MMHANSQPSTTLTRQHFQAIAATITRHRDCFDDRQRFAEAMAAELARFNPRFDRSRFLRACGIEGA